MLSCVESATAKAKKKQAEKVKTKRGQNYFFPSPQEEFSSIYYWFLQLFIKLFRQVFGEFVLGLLAVGVTVTRRLPASADDEK